MAKKNSLQGLIDDLDELSKNFDILLDYKYDDIMAKLFVLIGQTTAYDTGVSRDIIKDILSDLGRSDLQSELEHKVYEFWQTREHREQYGQVDYSFVKRNGKYEISIEDYGIAQQNDGLVSDIHPRQDPNVVANNIDMALDKLETDADRNIVKSFNELEKMICKLIEKGG